MHKGKKTALIFGVVVGALVALSFLLPILLDLDKYRRFVAELAGNKINREVSMDHLKLSLWRGLGVELQNLKVSDREGFGEGPFLSAAQVRVEVKVLPLLRKKVEVKQVVIDRPDIAVELNREGIYNFSDMLPTKKTVREKSPAAAATPGARVEDKPLPPPARLLGAMLISKLSLKDGRVTFVDQRSRPGTRLVTPISDIDLGVDNFSADSPFSVNLRARVGKAKGHNVRLKGTVTPGREATGTAAFDFTVNVANLDLAVLYPYFSHRVPLAWEDGLLTADLRLSGSTGKEVKAVGEISLHGLGMGEGKSAPGQANIRIDEDIAYDVRKASVTLKPTQITVGESELEVYGTISNVNAEPQLDLHVTSHNFDLDTVSLLYPPLREGFPQELKFAGDTAFSLNLRGTAKKLTAQGSVDLNRAEISYGRYFQKARQLPMNVDFRVAAAGEVVRIDSLNADLGELWFDLSGTVKTKPEPELDLKFFTSPVPLETLKKFVPGLKDKRLQGRLRLEGSVQGPVNAPDSMRFHIKASFEEVGQTGAIYNNP